MIICAFENSPSIPSFLVTKIVFIGYDQLKKWLLFPLPFHSCAPCRAHQTRWSGRNSRPISAEVALPRLQSEIKVALFIFASHSFLANNLRFMVKLTFTFTFTGILWRAVKQHQPTGKLLWSGFHTRPLKVVRIYSLKLFTAPLYPTLQ
jgi:hypothetical protein